jgi:Bacteriophage CI repressor helix-turn-helix domain
MRKPQNPNSGGSYIRRKDGTLRRQSPEEEQAALQRDRRTFAEQVDETLKVEQLGAPAVFDRIKEVLGIDSDAEIAWLLGISPQSLWNRKKRNAVPYREAVFVSLWSGASLDYLLAGREDAKGVAQ